MKLTDIAKEALKDVFTEDMTLQEHDLRYHDNNYRGGKCKFRENLEIGDNSDSAMNSANEEESIVYGARRWEGKQIEDAIYKNFSFLSSQNSRIQFLEPDKNGNNKLMIWCNTSVSDDKLSKDKLLKVLGEFGYKDGGNYSIMEEKYNWNGLGKAKKSRKLFVLDTARKGGDNIKYAKENKQDAATVITQRMKDNLSDEEKSRALKQYGLKVVDGVLQERTKEDNRKDRIARYLGLFGDTEGQSNREDLASGKWEKRRLEALKRSAEARKRELVEE